MGFSPVAGGATGTEKVARVTGASGYIASWIVKLLLARGYTVRATVRDHDTAKTAHLRAMDGAGNRLHFFKADLVEEGSFDAVVAGCHCVFHTASPVVPNTKDPQAELIDPALKGTLNLLSSCKKASVERRWYWYSLSKTLAEEAAWTFSKDSGLDLVTINPGWVIRPLLQPKLNTGAGAIMELISGKPTYPNLSHDFVNVKDVAMAHVLAYEVPSANGSCADDKPFAPKFRVSKDKIISLGIELTSLETSIKETVDSLKENGFVSF